MILVDMNQCMISNLMMQLKNNDDELDEDMVRHMVLSSLKSYKKKFTEEYGQMILCYDSKHYWRKQVFPYYKQNRKKDRQKSKFDWNKIFDCLNKIRDEIRDNFPFIVIEVYGAEADDVIAILCKYQSIRNISLQKQNRTPEKTLVLSGDKDFIQLQKYPSVSQFNPLQKKFVTGIDPKMYVKEHIIKGDRSDGIPNFLSPDDTFVEGKRQKPISIKNIDKWIQRDPETYCNEEQLRNYHRNKKLVDLDQIPEDIEKDIINSFAELISKKRSKVNFDYFYKNKLFSLMTELEDFND
jgi:5'-3' exonuclease